MPAERIAAGPLLVATAVIPLGPGTVRARARATGRMLLGDLLDELGAPGDEVGRRCEVCGSDAHGRPVAASGTVIVSVGYAVDRVAVAAAPASAGRAIGIDIEPDAGAGPLPGLDALFAPREPPDVRGWTGIEAALKADGRGLRVPPHLVVARPTEAGDILPGSHRVAVPGRGSRIEVAGIPAPAGYAISVAIDPG